MFSALRYTKHYLCLSFGKRYGKMPFPSSIETIWSTCKARKSLLIATWPSHLKMIHRFLRA